LTVTPDCAGVVKRVAKERGHTLNRVVTDVLEHWFRRRKNRSRRVKRR
jgi:hypothetical protein